MQVFIHIINADIVAHFTVFMDGVQIGHTVLRDHNGNTVPLIEEAYRPVHASAVNDPAQRIFGRIVVYSFLA